MKRFKQRATTFGVITAGFLAIIFVIAAIMGLLTIGDETANKALSSQGFTDIKLGGYSFLGCSSDQKFSVTFEAKSVTGAPVEGVICKSFFGGASVRTY